MSTEARFPPDWLDVRRQGRAGDLDLAVLLVNTLDLLEDPPDRLDAIDWWVDVLSQVGQADLAGELGPEDLTGLRRLRATLRTAFEADDVDTVAATLNPALLHAEAVHLLAGDGFTPRPDLRGLAAVEARLPAAVAAHVASYGAARLGVCSSDPCRCVYVDRTRAATRRYCCGWCNDRRAARRYRERRRSGS